MQTLSTSAYLDCDNEIINKIQDITQSHILHLTKNDVDNKKIDEIYDCLKIMLNGNYEKYKFDKNFIDKLSYNCLSEDEVQNSLSKLNEKQSERKTNGVYYTPKDVVSFIVNNCFNQKISKSKQIINNLNSNNDLLHFVVYNDSVFDPTCGTGEFLLGALEKKIDLIKNEQTGITDTKLLSILETIYGNDINIESVEITKIRLFFEIIKYTNSIRYYHYYADTINKNISCKDFVNVNVLSLKKHDIILGNPPYVEDRKSPIKPIVKYGNIYANVLQNSIDLLRENGIIGFIIPISYISTPRMKKIRQYIQDHTEKQFILNYADRPDCLFTSVHQKLSIIIAKQGKQQHKLYTSGYKYWYKSERNSLFKETNITENTFTYNDFYPKIGNNIEKSIFTKIVNKNNDNLLTKNLEKQNNIFLNMRACFWIKAFSFNPGSNEYKGFSYDTNIKDFILCLLNSSLFFFFWNTVSDCWHITSKELKYFRLPDDIENINIFKTLSKELENKLEDTKKYIGTKQTEYEYKHKLCKDVIDKIDNEMAKIYQLTEEELNYIKSYSSKYRESLGN